MRSQRASSNMYRLYSVRGPHTLPSRSATWRLWSHNNAQGQDAPPLMCELCVYRFQSRENTQRRCVCAVGDRGLTARQPPDTRQLRNLRVKRKYRIQREPLARQCKFRLSAFAYTLTAACRRITDIIRHNGPPALAHASRHPALRAPRVRTRGPSRCSAATACGHWLAPVPMLLSVYLYICVSVVGYNSPVRTNLIRCTHAVRDGVYLTNVARPHTSTLQHTSHVKLPKHSGRE